MKYNILGKSTLKVSEISFGCMSLGTDSTANAQLIHRALELGINFFDTADLYQQGENEKQLGNALKGKRAEALIATKAGNQWNSDGSWNWNPRPEYLRKALEDSLRRLQTDYIDLYQLHGGTLEDPIDDIIALFEELKQQGKIRYYGISSIRPNVIREYVARSGIVSVMMQYSLVDRRPEESCFPLLQEHNISVLARGGIAKGMLAGKEPAAFLSYAAEEVARAAAAVKALSGKDRSASQTALRFVLAPPVVASAVTGIRTPAQLEEAAAVSDTPLLTAGEISSLGNVLKANKYDQHR
ncbi:aldo/keto reductase [Chitinophaga tropicalis]|uniref:Aldo/keto reductase n=1 Tax=Chitinophaga tropicalis TaxID=2683588 RepID=A0A7K1U9Y9_9BACT|nr:aldo/keto reductase [Chitinophaga tropicalis]MVT11126.1 aldo/keto reductase [Chitinophaga tropicalis]